MLGLIIVEAVEVLLMLPKRKKMDALTIKRNKLSMDVFEKVRALTNK